VSRTDSIELARRIYQERVGRKVGAIATIGGIAGAGVLGLLRYHGLTEYSFSVVTAAFAGGMLVGPLADRIGRRLARRRFHRALAAESESDAAAQLDLRRQLRAQSLAASVEGSEAWPLAKSAVLAIVSWLWLFGIAIGDVGSTVGKALSYLTTHGGIAIALFAVAAHLQGRSMTEKKKKPRALITLAVMLAMILPALTAHAAFPISVAVSAFYVGIAGVFVMFPSVWWSRRRLLRERRALEQLVLPASTEDEDGARRMLMSALDWQDGPPALRASALRELGARLELAEIGPHIDRALTSGVTELRRAGLELSKSVRYRPPVDILLRIENEPEAAMLPPLLHRHRSAEVEPALLRLVARKDPSIASAAAESLGLVGSIGSIPVLKQIASRDGGRVATVCDEAIERIRIRHTCTPGQLALIADPEAGALSEPTAEPAALSFAKRD
jgi:MFS family permease